MFSTKKQNRRNRRRYGRRRPVNTHAIEIAATLGLGLPLIAIIFALAIYS